MNGDLLLVAALAGAANWAFRVLPTRARTDRLAAGERIERFLSATGPAAITTLFVASILPDLSSDLLRLIPGLSGIAAVLVAYRISQSVVAATLAGSVFYSLIFWALG